MQRYEVRISSPPYPDPFLGCDPAQFITTTPPNIQVLSNQFGNPYSQQMNVGLTRQLTSDMAVHVDGVYTRVLRDRKTRNKWAANLEPLAKLLLERTVPYLHTLAAPMRIGTHANTAYTLKLLLEYARTAAEKGLENAVIERARKFYAADVGCAPNFEPSGSDFFSPCLSEAALMSEVLPPAEFVRWLDAFLPRPDSPGFKALTIVVEMPGSAEELKKSDMEGAKSHLMGLGVSRAKALEDIAAALPPGDPRVAAYRKLAASLARSSIKAMYDADYAGTHWIATYIVDYLVSARPRALTNGPS